MKRTIFFFYVWFYLFSIKIVYAQFNEDVNLGANQTKGIIVKNSPKILDIIITNSIRIFFVVGAIAVLFMMLWGATEWIFSGGDKEKVAGARRRITHALIGLVLLALGLLIVAIVGKLVNLNPFDPSCLPILNAPSGATSSDLNNCI